MKNNLESSQDKVLLDKEGKPVDIPIGGSLSLLAWGDVGYYAWQKERSKFKKTNDEE